MINKHDKPIDFVVMFFVFLMMLTMMATAGGCLIDQWWKAKARYEKDTQMAEETVPEEKR